MRIPRLLLLVLVSAMVLVATVAIHATTHTFKSGFKFTVPDTWTMENGKKNQVLAMAPGKKALVTFEVVSKKSNIDAVLDDFDQRLEKLVTDLKVTSKKKVTVNGLKTVLVGGTAKLKGTPCQVMLAVYSGGGRYLVAFTLIPDVFYKELETPVVDIFNSVSKP